MNTAKSVLLNQAPVPRNPVKVKVALERRLFKGIPCKRTEELTLDAENPATIDTKAVQKFCKAKYPRWNVTGWMLIK